MLLSLSPVTFTMLKHYFLCLIEKNGFLAVFMDIQTNLCVHVVLFKLTHFTVDFGVYLHDLFLLGIEEKFPSYVNLMTNKKIVI